MTTAELAALTIPEGEVIKIARGTEVLWEKKGNKNRWNLLERTEFIGDGTGTYYFVPTEGVGDSSDTMPLSESVYWNGGRRINDGSYVNAMQTNWISTLSNITEDGVTFTSGGTTELFVAIPFHLNAGETFEIKYYSDAVNRSGYQIFNTDGTFRSYTFESKTGAGTKTHTYTAEDECWIAWIIGQYSANASVTLSDIVLTIE